MAEIYEKKQLSKKEKMEELRKQLADLELPDPLETQFDLEMPKPLMVSSLNEGSETSVSDDDEVQVKPKRERTEKQRLAFEKAQATRLLKAEERRKQRMQKEEEEKKELEQKLIEKAIKVKKKQLKKMKAIEELSDDDTPIEKPIKKLISKPEPKPEYKIRFLK